MQTLHGLILSLLPDGKLWFFEGKDDYGRIVSNPNIGYGCQTISSAAGKTREFYQIGMSANTVGISIYIIGIPDKTYLARRYGKRLGNASVTGYCIKFRTLRTLNLDVLEAVIRDGIAQTSGTMGNFTPNK